MSSFEPCETVSIYVGANRTIVEAMFTHLTTLSSVYFEQLKKPTEAQTRLAGSVFDKQNLSIPNTSFVCTVAGTRFSRGMKYSYF
jgi:hypothetical protein